MTDRVEVNQEDVADSSESETKETSEVPEWVADKFRDSENPVEAQAQAYLEAEKRLHEKSTETPEPNPERTEEGVPGPLSDLITEAGSLIDQGQALTDDLYGKFAEQGVPREMVDSYIESQQVVAEAEAARLYEAAGGPDAMATMVEWASTELTAEQKAEFNEAVRGADRENAVAAIQALKSAYEQAEGAPPSSRVEGGSSAGGPAVQPFGSTAEMAAAMADPRYAVDEAYRQEVERRLSVSSNL